MRVLDSESVQGGLHFAGERAAGEAVLLLYAGGPILSAGPLEPVSAPDTSAGPLPRADRVFVAGAKGDWRWEEGARPPWLDALRFLEFGGDRCPTPREQQRVELTIPGLLGVDALLALEDETVLVAARLEGDRSALYLFDAALTLRPVVPELVPPISDLTRLGDQIWIGDDRGGLRRLDLARGEIAPPSPLQLGPRDVTFSSSALGLLAVSGCGCMAQLAPGDPEWRAVATPAGLCGTVAADCWRRMSTVATSTLAITLTGGFRDEHQSEVLRLDHGRATYECVEAEPLRVGSVRTLFRHADGSTTVFGSNINGGRMRFTAVSGGPCPWGNGRLIPNLLFADLIVVLARANGELVYSGQGARLGVLPPDRDCDGITLSGQQTNLDAMAFFPVDTDGVERVLVGSKGAANLWLVRIE